MLLLLLLLLLFSGSIEMETRDREATGREVEGNIEEQSIFLYLRDVSKDICM